MITGLLSETSYSVTVAAYTTKGDGARSKAKVVTTTGAGRNSLSSLDLLHIQNSLCLISMHVSGLTLHYSLMHIVPKKNNLKSNNFTSGTSFINWWHKMLYCTEWPDLLTKTSHYRIKKVSLT